MSSFSRSSSQKNTASATAVRPAALSQRRRSCFEIIKITLACPGSKTLILNYRDGTGSLWPWITYRDPEGVGCIEAINGTAHRERLGRTVITST